MADQLCRLTVVGQQYRVDFALPAHAPIAEYAPRLANLCGQQGSDVLPPVWSLAQAGRKPFPVSASLAEAGVTDGEILYLRDLAEGEADEPVIMELDELVEDAARNTWTPPWNRRSRAIATIIGSLAILVATPGALGTVRAGVSLPLVLGVGLLLPMLARLVARANAGRPAADWIRTLLALGAIPTLAAAGGSLVIVGSSGSASTIGALVGATIGALAAVAAMPGRLTVTVALGTLSAAVTVGVPVSLDLTHAQGMTVAVMIAFAGLSMVPWAAAHVVAMFPHQRQAAEATEAVPTAVKDAHVVLVSLTAVLGALLTYGLANLAAASQPFAAPLAACLSMALLLRTRTAAMVTEVVPPLVAGGVGLIVLLLVQPNRLGAPGWLTPCLAGLLGVALLFVGLVLLLWRSHGHDDDPDIRRGWLKIVTACCGIATVPLSIGVFGVYQWLVTVGHQL